MDKIAAEERLARIAKSLAAALSRGGDMENGSIRVHRWNSSIRVWDLTNAGRIGKQVDTIAVYDLDMAGKEADAQVETLADNISRARSYGQAKDLIQKAVEEINAVSLYKVKIVEDRERGIDVPPAGFKPIEINGRHVSVEADYDSFSVRDKEDKFNEPTCIPTHGSKRDVKVFYMWVRDNQSLIQNATFHEVMEGMSKAGIRYHYYCAVD